MPAIRSLWPYWTCWAYAVSPISGLRMRCAPPPPVAGRLDQCAEQSFIPGHLGMPLDAQHKPAARVLDRLGQAVGGTSGDRERAGIGDALVVVTVDLHIVAHQRGDPAAIGESRRLAAVDARRRTVLLVPQHVGQML